MNQISQLLNRYILLILTGPEIRDLYVDQPFEILKNRRKVKIANMIRCIHTQTFQNQKEEKNFDRKRKIIRITPSIYVTIANMIRFLLIFERFSILRRFKYSFIEKCIYLTMYLKGLY